MSQLESDLEVIRRADTDGAMPDSDQVAFLSVLQPFAMEAKQTSSTTCATVNAAVAAFREMAQYFGEDPATTTPLDFFGVLCKFFLQFEAAHKQNVKEKEKKEGAVAKNRSITKPTASALEQQQQQQPPTQEHS